MNVFICGDHDVSKFGLGEKVSQRLKIKCVNKISSIDLKKEFVFDGYIHPKDFITLFNPKKDIVLVVQVVTDLPSIATSSLDTINSYLRFLIHAVKTLNKNQVVRRTFLDTVLEPELLINDLMMTAKQSVCILLKDKTTGLYLGVSRKDDFTNFGLPGGKKEPIETLEDGIKRETKEETGLDITNLKQVFSDFVKSNRVYYCTTFTGDYSGEIYTEEKGVVKWVNKETLLNGSFGAYNRKLFTHLGIL